jgi:hypothetical protein
VKDHRPSALPFRFVFDLNIGGALVAHSDTPVGAMGPLG